ncbi:hypothetical protein [Colwellia sp.]|nr:hypothetical protein [Colwellia sp.]
MSLITQPNQRKFTTELLFLESEASLHREEKDTKEENNEEIVF